MLELFRILDWMMDLPSGLEQLFKADAKQIEEELHMPYVTSVVSHKTCNEFGVWLVNH